MKKLLILFGILIAIPAICQIEGKIANVTINKLYVAQKQIPAIPGYSYTWTIPNDTALIFVPPEGQTIKIVTQFHQNDTPPVYKETIENTAGVYRLADGTIVNPGVNVYNTAVWNNFNKIGPPAAAWCDVFSQDNCHFVYSTNLTASFAFSGRRAELYGEKSDNKGKVAVTIDNGPEVIYDLYAATSVNNTQFLFAVDGAPGNHILKVRNLGEKNSASTSTNFLVDYVKVFE